MNSYKKACFCVGVIVVLFSFQDSYAQVNIDSTSKQTPYGPRNTQFTNLKKIHLLDSLFLPLDTLPTQYSRFEYIDVLKRRYQDTGNLGGALNPIFQEKTTEIGASPGYNGYNLYFLNPDSTKFFDTRSPYTQLDIYLAGNNRNRINLTFTRSINKRWNVGVDLRNIVSAKQISGRGREDFFVTSLSYSLYSRYESKNKKYTFLTGLYRTKHTVNESGGIVPIEINEENEYYGYNNNAAVWTNTAIGVFNRVQWRLYHQYKFWNNLYLYHQFDTYRKTTTYEDTNPIGDASSTNATLNTTIENPLFKQYPNFLLPVTQTLDENAFLGTENTIGIKNRTKKMYYATHLKHRVWTNEFQILPNLNTQQEVYIGGQFKYWLNKDMDIDVKTEWGNQGQYLINAKIHIPYFSMDYQVTRRIAPLLYNYQLTAYDAWNNDFKQETKEYLVGKVNFPLSKGTVGAFASAVRINNPLVFNKDRVPEQPDVNATQVQVGVAWNVKLWYIHFAGNVAYTKNLEHGELIPAPESFLFQEIYFDKVIFNNVMHAEIGFQIHWRADYFPKAYDPRLQSFYLQDDFNAQAYPVVDFFWRFKVGHARAVIKLTNIRQMIESPREGYFTTPYYTGVPFVVDLGFGWMFFN